MDNIDRKIIDILAVDAKRPLADIGQGVGLSASAVNERLRRLSASGAIRRFTIDTDPAALDRPVLAFVWLGLAGDADEAAFRRYATGHPAIAECHHVTGAWSYLIKIHVPSLSGVEGFLADLKAGGFAARTETIIALTSVVPGPFVPREGMP